MSNVSLYRRRDPFLREFDALVRSSFGPTAFGAGTVGTGSGITFTPAAETTRDGDDAVVRLEIPGVDAAKDVEVEVVSGRLVVRGERREERTDETGGRHLREIRYGRFERSFALPGHITAAGISASYDAGVLSIRVAGAYAGTNPTRIAVSTAPAAEPAVEPAVEPVDEAGAEPTEEG